MATNNNKYYLCDGLSEYVTDTAALMINRLVTNGLDLDLAFEITASLLPEDEMYELPPKKDLDSWTE